MKSEALAARPRLEIVRRLATAARSRPDVGKGAISLIDQTIVSGASFLTSVIIARACSQAELGIYFLALNIVFFIRGLQVEAIAAPYMVVAARVRRSDAANYTGSAVVFQGGVIAISIAGLLALIGALALGYGPEPLLPVAVVLVAVAPFMFFREFLRQLAFSHIRPGAALAMDAGGVVVQLGLLWLLASMGTLTIPLVYVAIGGSCALVCLSWTMARRLPLRVRRRRIRPHLRETWRLGRWGILSHAIGSFAPLFLPWVLTLLHTESATGVLAACATLVGVSNIYILGISNYLGPRAARAYAAGGTGGLTSVLLGAVAIFLVSLGALLVAMLVAGEWLVVAIFGADYTGTSLVVVLLTATVLVKSVGITAGNGLWAIERPRFNVIADIVSLSTTIVAALILVPEHGVVGAAIAGLIATVAAALTRAATLARLLQLRASREATT